MYFFRLAGFTSDAEFTALKTGCLLIQISNAAARGRLWEINRYFIIKSKTYDCCPNAKEQGSRQKLPCSFALFTNGKAAAV